MTEETADEVSWGLIVRFPDQSESFTLGYETGLVAADLRDPECKGVTGTFHTKNVEVFNEIAEAYGWVIDVQLYAEDPTWAMISFERKPPMPKMPPLRVVQ